MNQQHPLGLPMANPSDVGLCNDRVARIAPAMSTYLDSGQVSGLVTVVARHGKLVHAQAQGLADVASGKPMQTDTIFRIYSMTKPITAVAVMMLYEEGRFFLDEPIARYLPEFRQMKVYTPKGLVDANQPIRIRHLLTHSAGLTYSMTQDQPAVSELYATEGVNEVISRLSSRTLEEHVKLLASFPLIAQPGTEWHYGENLCLLARLVEILSGLSYGEFLQQRIFTPLGMVDSGYHVPEEQQHRLATLYKQSPDRQGFAPTDSYGGDYGQKPPLEPGGAGLVSTAADYLRFCQMLLNGGELDGVRLLSPTTLTMIMSDHFGGTFAELAADSFLANYKGMGFGFCGYVVTDPITRSGTGSVGEYGWGGWANTKFWVDPQERLIGMVLTQLIPQPNAVLTLGEKMHQMTYQAITQSAK